MATLTLEVIMGLFLLAPLLWTMSNAQDLSSISRIAPMTCLITAVPVKARGFTATNEIMSGNTFDLEIL